MTPLQPLKLLANVGFNPEAQASNLPIHGNNPEADFWGYVSTILSAVLTVAALMLFLYLIIAGFEWLTSAGDKGKVEAARQRITNGVVGMLVLASAVVLLMVVQSILGVEVIKINGGGGPGGPPGGPPTCDISPVPGCVPVPI